MVSTNFPITKLSLPAKKLVGFCLHWKVSELALFGSVLRDDFRPDSDVDMLVSFTSDAHWTLLDLVRMQNELVHIFGRKVDLVERNAVEKSENYIRRKQILSEAKIIYAA